MFSSLRLECKVLSQSWFTVFLSRHVCELNDGVARVRALYNAADAAQSAIDCFASNKYELP